MVVIRRYPEWSAYVLALLAAVVVLTTARRPPVLDLGQQLDQVRLAAAAWSGGRPDLEVQLLGSNRLGYLPLAVAWITAPDSWAPRVALLLSAALWLAAVHSMARWAGSHPGSALLASTLLLGSSFYAGFFNFLMGMPAFAWWVWTLRDKERRRGVGRVAIVTFGGAMLLWLAHALWFAVGGFAVASYVLLRGCQRREFFGRALGFAAAVPLVVTTGSSLGASGWQTDVRMMVPVLDRLTDRNISATIAFGGVRGPVEGLLFAVLLLWIGFALLRCVREPEQRPHRFLSGAGLLFLVIAFLAPDGVDKTIFFAWRWGAPGFALILLALPLPTRRASIAVTTAVVALAIQAAFSVAAWRAFDRMEMAGFEDCIAALPEGARVFGADSQMESPRFRVSPFFQMLGYAGLERGAELNFSFVDYPSSLVVRRRTSGDLIRNDYLLRNPTGLRPSHLRGYTHLLVHGEPGTARLYEESGFLRSVAGHDNWHLLEVDGQALDRLLGLLGTYPTP